MSKLKILTGADNEILRKKSVPVKKFDAGLKKLVKDMRKTMEAAKGLGLAAPQVGVNERIFITTLNHGENNEMQICMINPEIVILDNELQLGEEGCLSLPGIWANVNRFKKIHVEFFDADGNRQALTLSDLNARVVQHENDHLDGVLFIDLVEEQKKDEYLSK